VSVAEAFVTVRPDMDRFGSDLQSKLGGMAGFAAKAGAGIAAGLAAAVGVAFKIGSEFQDATNTIRIGTGATGDALAELRGSFDNVVRDVPASFADASTAVADLNTRLGLTGEPLETLSGQFLDLARITGGDVAEQIRLGTRVFGDWDVATAQQADTLDSLFRAAQGSGAGIEQLMGQVVQFGSPLRAMGFSLEESVALFAQFEREGVNAELVIGSLRQGLGRMARAGEDAPETFRRIVTEIEGMESRTEATALAMELFGARAGPDMAAAIQEGRFSIEEMLAAIEGGEDTIAKAASDTEGFSEAWQRFKNNAMLALEPVAQRVFDLLADKMDVLADWFRDNGPAIEAWINDTLIPAFENMVAWWVENGPTVIERIRDIASAIGTFVERAVEGWHQFNEGFLQPLLEGWRQIDENFIQGLVQGWGQIERGFIEPFVEGWGQLDRGFFQKFAEGVDQIMEVPGKFAQGWDQIDRGFIQKFIQGWDQLDRGFFQKFVEGGNQILRFVSGRLVPGFQQGWDQILRAAQRLGDGLREGWDQIVRAGEFFVDAIRQGVDQIVTFFRELPGRIISALSGAGSQLAGAGRDMMSGLVGGITGAAGSVTSAVSSAVSNAVSSARRLLGIESPSRVFMEIGEQTTAGLALGLSKDADRVSRAMLSMLDVPAAPTFRGPGGDASSQGGVHFHGPITVGTSRDLGDLRYQMRLAAVEAS
jgi:TP901 family phage tail tape measure protein